MRGVARNKKIRLGFLMIWHATLWCIWRARNNAIFANGSFTPKAIVDDIKVLSWKWCLARTKISPCMFEAPRSGCCAVVSLHGPFLCFRRSLFLVMGLVAML
ncbi:ubiquinone biosynthesis monooxygenase COQ6 [Trifolium pratense]|uniref:Ubiquinone biosynthesis monooxygenase COQ6 n=1 Tax=Trifolium pratense TaxID=57577 RepID=A0A2K3NZ73_TRIPR|nr:ubiquinone biosynthesis monooxygenase COQ6 [Trifolium pratense]